MWVKTFSKKAYETRKQDIFEKCRTDLLTVSCEEATSNLNALCNERLKVLKECQAMPFDLYRKITNNGCNKEKNTIKNTPSGIIIRLIIM